MSSISLGSGWRVQSKMNNARSGFPTPEQVFNYNQITAAAGSVILFYNPSNINKFKVVDIRERHVTPGSAAMTLRIQDAAAGAVPPSQANTGTTIYTLASITTTTAANTWQRVGSGIAWAASPGSGINAQIIGPGDSLILDVPATIAGITLQVMGIWL